MAKVTKEKLAFQLAFDVNNAQWKTKQGIYGNGYDANLTAVLMTVALCGRIAMKDTTDGKEAAWQIAQLIALFLRDPEDIRTHFGHCLRTGYDMYRDVKPDDQADDQAQLNAFVLRALVQHDGLLERLRQMIEQFQTDKEMRCFSPAAWTRRWPWMSLNIFGVAVA